MTGPSRAGHAAAWGRLLRLSLAATVLGDVLAGSALARVTWQESSQVGLLILASLAVYHGGMAFNDWCDREHDRRTRPERPLPAGAIRPAAALSAALVLFVAGPLVASRVNSAAALGWAVLALCAAFYDFKGRGPWLGPLLLGTCRALNLGLPLLVLGPPEMSPVMGAAPLLYGLYVFVLSRLGRLEDGEGHARNQATPRRLLFGMAALFWLIPCLPIEGAGPQTRGLALVLCATASWGLVQAGRNLGEWKASDLLGAMGCALRRMLPFAAALALLAGTHFGLASAGLIMLMLPGSFWLRHRFPPS